MLTYADVFGIRVHAAGLGAVAGPREQAVLVYFSMYLTRLQLILIHASAGILIRVLVYFSIFLTRLLLILIRASADMLIHAATDP